MTCILRSEPPTVYGDGEQTRDFTYIDNVVHGNMLAMNVEKTEGQSVNVACGGQITVNHVIGEINRLLGTGVRPLDETLPWSVVDRGLRQLKAAPCHADGRCVTWRAQAARAKRLACFEDGLARTIEYYRSLT